MIMSIMIYIFQKQSESLLYRSLNRLADQLWQKDIPLLICRSYGLIGYLRVVLREHTGKMSRSFD